MKRRHYQNKKELNHKDYYDGFISVYQYYEQRNGPLLIGALEYKYGSLSFLRYNQIACQRTLLHTTAKA